MQAVWIKNAIALCLIVESCNGSDFIGPSDTSVPEGTRATLSCQTSPSKTVWWRYQQHDVFYANTISHAYKSSHEAEVDVSRGIYNLTILNASSHAGLYTCIDDDGEGESRSAWLTVTATETSPTPPAENNTMAIAVVSVCLVIIVIIIIIVIVLVIFCKRRSKRYRHKASTGIPNRTDEREAKEEEAEAGPLMNPGSQSEEQTIPDNDIDNLDENTPEHHEEPRKDIIKDHIVSTGPVDTPSMPNEQETPSESTPVENDESRNDNVNTTEPNSTIESKNTTDNTQTDPLKPATPRDNRPEVLPKLEKTTKAGESTPEPRENSSKNGAIASPGKQGPVTKPSKPNEPETLSASTTPEEKEKSENDNVSTTKPKSIIESINMKDNTQTDPLKPATRKDERSKVLPEPETTTKTDVSNVVSLPEENSPKNEVTVSLGKQDSVAKEKPKITRPKPKLASVSSNVRTGNTAKNDDSSRASNVEQGGHILSIEKDDSDQKQTEEGITKQEENERDLSKELLTEDDDDKKEISFKSEHIG